MACSFQFWALPLGFEWDSIVPRVGVAYALGETRRSLVRGSFSQYAQQLGHLTAQRTNPVGYAYAAFYFTDANQNLVLDDSDQVYVVGFFTDSADFESETLVSAGAEDIFIVRYDSDGVQLALQPGDDAADEIFVATAGGTGSDLATGVVLSQSRELDNLALTTTNTTDLFIIGAFETEANNFAGELLVPLAMLKKEFKKSNDLKQLSKIFWVSQHVAGISIKSHMTSLYQ